MAVTNTGIVLRTITGVNESDLFLDSEATSVTTNTGIVERSITGVNESDLWLDNEATSVVNNTGIVERSVTGLNESIAFRQDVRTNLISYSEDFSNVSWLKVNTTITNDYGISPDGTNNSTRLVFGSGAAYVNRSEAIGVGDQASSIYVKGISGQILKFGKGGNVGAGSNFTLNGEWQRLEQISTNSGTAYHISSNIGGANATEVEVWGAQLENLSYATSYIPTNGAAVTIDNNSTSVVNNTGIVERPITGVNESDALFPDNTDSAVVNISQFIIPLLADLEARATTFENRDATQNILINLQKC